MLGPAKSGGVVIESVLPLFSHSVVTDENGHFGPVPIPRSYDGVVSVRAGFSKFVCDSPAGCPASSGTLTSFGDIVSDGVSMLASVADLPSGTTWVTVSPFSSAVALRARTLGRIRTETLATATADMDRYLDAYLEALPGIATLDRPYYTYRLTDLSHFPAAGNTPDSREIVLSEA